MNLHTKGGRNSRRIPSFHRKYDQIVFNPDALDDAGLSGLLRLEVQLHTLKRLLAGCEHLLPREPPFVLGPGSRRKLLDGRTKKSDFILAGIDDGAERAGGISALIALDLHGDLVGKRSLDASPSLL